MDLGLMHGGWRVLLVNHMYSSLIMIIDLAFHLYFEILHLNAELFKQNS